MNLHKYIINFTAMLLVFMTVAFAQYAGGSGTSGDPYQVATTAQWITMIQDAANNTKYYKLVADLDFTGVTYPVNSTYMPRSITGDKEGDLPYIVRDITIPVNGARASYSLFASSRNSQTMTDINFRNIKFEINWTGGTNVSIALVLCAPRGDGETPYGTLRLTRIYVDSLKVSSVPTASATFPIVAVGGLIAGTKVNAQPPILTDCYVKDFDVSYNAKLNTYLTQNRLIIAPVWATFDPSSYPVATRVSVLKMNIHDINPVGSGASIPYVGISGFASYYATTGSANIKDSYIEGRIQSTYNYLNIGGLASHDVLAANGLSALLQLRYSVPDVPTVKLRSIVTGAGNGSLQSVFINSNLVSASTPVGGTFTTPPVYADSLTLKQQGTYPLWDFVSTWQINIAKNHSYPYLRSYHWVFPNSAPVIVPDTASIIRYGKYPITDTTTYVYTLTHQDSLEVLYNSNTFMKGALIRAAFIKTNYDPNAPLAGLPEFGIIALNGRTVIPMPKQEYSAVKVYVTPIRGYIQESSGNWTVTLSTGASDQYKTGVKDSLTIRIDGVDTKWVKITDVTYNTPTSKYKVKIQSCGAERLKAEAIFFGYKPKIGGIPDSVVSEKKVFYYKDFEKRGVTPDEIRYQVQDHEIDVAPYLPQDVLDKYDSVGVKLTVKRPFLKRDLVQGGNVSAVHMGAPRQPVFVAELLYMKFTWGWVKGNGWVNNVDWSKQGLDGDWAAGGMRAVQGYSYVGRHSTLTVVPTDAGLSGSAMTYLANSMRADAPNKLQIMNIAQAMIPTQPGLSTPAMIKRDGMNGLSGGTNGTLIGTGEGNYSKPFTYKGTQLASNTLYFLVQLPKGELFEDGSSSAMLNVYRRANATYAGGSTGLYYPGMDMLWVNGTVGTASGRQLLAVHLGGSVGLLQLPDVALPQPADEYIFTANFSQNDYGEGDMGDAVAVVHYFRGIHPKIWKWGREDGEYYELLPKPIIRNYFRGIHPKIWKFGNINGVEDEIIN